MQNSDITDISGVVNYFETLFSALNDRFFDGILNKPSIFISTDYKPYISYSKD